MPIHKGTGGNLSAIYRGSTPVTAVYRGADKIWPAKEWTVLSDMRLTRGNTNDIQVQNLGAIFEVRVENTSTALLLVPGFPNALH